MDRRTAMQMMTIHAILKHYAANCIDGFFLSADLFYNVPKKPLAAVEV
jgi:hypothetical protein